MKISVAKGGIVGVQLWSMGTTRVCVVCIVDTTAAVYFYFKAGIKVANFVEIGVGEDLKNHE